MWDAGGEKKVWAFHANMGAGKTTLIHAVCDLLQVEDAVGSPTFAIINEYKSATAGVVFHMDWYRIKNTEEAINAGMEDCLLNADAYSFIEWPEKAKQLLPHPHLWIDIKTTGPKERKMTLWLKTE